MDSDIDLIIKVRDSTAANVATCRYYLRHNNCIPERAVDMFFDDQQNHRLHEVENNEKDQQMEDILNPPMEIKIIDDEPKESTDIPIDDEKARDLSVTPEQRSEPIVQEEIKDTADISESGNVDSEDKHELIISEGVNDDKTAQIPTQTSTFLEHRALQEDIANIRIIQSNLFYYCCCCYCFILLLLYFIFDAPPVRIHSSDELSRLFPVSLTKKTEQEFLGVCHQNSFMSNQYDDVCKHLQNGEIVYCFFYDDKDEINFGYFYTLWSNPSVIQFFEHSFVFYSCMSTMPSLQYPYIYPPNSLCITDAIRMDTTDNHIELIKRCISVVDPDMLIKILQRDIQNPKN
ncbi:hypothetical protein WA158_006192 [Blastocystis sp. Blastoise]